MHKGVKRNKMEGKTSAHVRSVIKSQVVELIRNQKIKTTPAKAKILKSVFDKLVTSGKKEGESSKKGVEEFFGNNQRAVERFFAVVKTQLQGRESGYTRIFKTLPRKGDGAAQVYIMLTSTIEKTKKSEVDKLLEQKENSKKKSKKKDK